MSWWEDHGPAPVPIKPPFPVRPYWIDDEPSAGHTRGSDTSRDAEKKRVSYQEKSWDVVAAAGAVGLTAGEARKLIGQSQSVNSALSTMALATELGFDYVVALKEKRDRAHVYVLPCYTMGRPIEPRHFHGSNELLFTALQAVLDLVESHQLDEKAEALVRAALAHLGGEETPDE